jgi:hypothetical protein
MIMPPPKSAQPLAVAFMPSPPAPSSERLTDAVSIFHGGSEKNLMLAGVMPWRAGTMTRPDVRDFSPEYEKIGR